jgi:hypothetical protein
MDCCNGMELIELKGHRFALMPMFCVGVLAPFHD